MTTDKVIEVLREFASHPAAIEAVNVLDAFVDETLGACKALIDADHYDHFAARMSDSEMAAIERIKAVLAAAQAKE